MAKQDKITKIIEIDVVTKGADIAQKAIEGIDSSQGALYNSAQKIQKRINKIKEITQEYGENIPVAKAKEMSTYMREISEEMATMADMDEVVIFNKKESDHLKKISDEIQNITNKIKDIQNTKAKISVEMETERIEDLKKQKTAKGADGKSVSLSSLKNEDGSSKFNSKADLEKLAKDKDEEVAKAAQAALHQLGITAQKAATKIATLTEEENKLQESLRKHNEEYNSLSHVTKTLSNEEKTRYETASRYMSEHVKGVEEAVEAAQKEGEEFVKAGKKVDGHNISLGRAVKSLFSWTAVWNLGKRMLKEAVKTVTEMDKALTGMAVVTSMSREETNALIPRIQELASETSTAMTEVANLITEYTRQGRSLSDSFKLAEETAKAAKIAGISAAESIKYMTSAINGFNLAASEATRVSDIFANLAAISATDYEQLAISLSKVSAQANLAGMSIEFTTALLAKGIETTQEAPESIGTALKTIVARMRELSDYGKTLEDGASVNKVENALASAGIKLRDVNGEFRDLEVIFNELGPKWDTLNTMQQQAIAQAVAGTRQQSRFVAIMQDWERTQELAAEAQDSAGASAAQYYKQAQGMEAAMTNLTTAWQKFIQSLTSSKFIINVVKTTTKLLDGLTNVMSIGGDFTKSLAAGIITVIAAASALQKINKFKQAFGNWVAEKTAQEEQDNKDITAEKVKQLAAEKGISEEQARQLLANKKQLAFEKELAKLKYDEAVKSADKRYDKAVKDEEDLNKAGSIDDEAYTQAYTEMKLAEDDKKAAKDIYKEEVTNLDNAMQNGSNANVELEYNWKQKLLMLEQESQQIQLEKVDTAIAENEELRRKLETEQLITDEKIRQLEIEQNKDSTTDERKAEIAKELEGWNDKRKRTESVLEKLSKSDNKLAAKRSKILKGDVGLWTKTGNIFGMIVNKTAKKFGIDTTKISKAWKGIKDSFGKLKSQTDENNVSLSKLLTGEQERVKKYDEMLEKGKFINAQGEEQLLTEEQVAVLKDRKATAEQNIENIQKAQQDLGTEGLVTQKQAGKLLQVEQMTQKGILVTESGQITAEQQENAATAAGLPTEVAEATANISESASQPYGVGLPFAMMGIALLAAVGLGAGIAGIISSSSGAQAKKQDKAAEEAIQKNSVTVYEKKKENSSLSTDLEEYKKLYNKSYRTEEDNKRLEELTESLQEADESFAGLSGESLMGAVSGKISDNTDTINHLIDTNFDSALNMNSLENSLIGQQAITAKLIDSQEDLIASNKLLWESNNEQLNKNVAESSKSMAEELAASFNYADYLKTDNYGVGDYFSTIAQYMIPLTVAGTTVGTMFAGVGSAVGAAVGAGIGLITGTIDAIVADVNNSKTRKKEQEEAEGMLEYYNSRIVEMAVAMESEIARRETTLASQIKKYNELESTLEDGGMEETLLANQYGMLDFMADITKADNQVLQNIDKLTSLGVVTEDAIKRLAETFSNFDTKERELNSVLGKMKSTHDDWGNHSTLADVAKEYGAGENFTAAELREKMMENVKYKDGEAAKDKNNNYKERHGHGVDNEEFTNIIEYLDTIIASGYGDMSQSTIEGLLKVVSTGDPSKMFTGILNGMADSINSNMSPEEQARAMMDAYNDNSQAAKAYIEQTKKSANDLYDQAQKLKEAGKVDEANEMRAQAAEYMKLANEFETELNDSYRAMVGDLTTNELNDFMAQFNSSLENAQNVKDAIAEGGEIDAEGYDYLVNNVIPTLQKELGETFDPSDFLRQAQEGTAEAMDYMDKYVEITTGENLDKLARNIVTKQDALTEAQQKLEETRASGDKYAIQDAEAKVNLAKSDLAYAESQYNVAEKQLRTEEEALKLQRRKSSLERKRDVLESQDDVLRTYEQQADILKDLAAVHEIEKNNAMEAAAKTLGITKDQLDNYLKMEKGQEYNAEQIEWVNDLSENGLTILEEQLSTIHEIEDGYDDAIQSLKDLASSWYETQIDQQSQVLDAYKTQLESEQESLQNSLDKRKEMYEKYFDSLEEEESDETFEEEQARLQRAIAALSTSTDATSLQKLKEYQQELADLEDEQRSTERERRRETVMDAMDNQSEALDQYYEDRLTNEQALWEEIEAMSSEEISSLMTTYNEEFENATDLNKEYMLLSYKQLQADIIAMTHGKNSAEAKAAQDEADNYEEFITAKGSGLVTATYDDSLNYAALNQEDAYQELYEEEKAKLKDGDEYYNESYEEWKKRKGYSQGGIVDYTGTAAVHGSPSKPEAFLNASQTALFGRLASNLEAFYTRASAITGGEDSGNNVVIENFTIAIDAELTDNNLNQTGQNLADALFEGLRRTGVSVNMKR